MVGLALVRVISHVHIACMHYFQLQPEAEGALVGFPSWAQWGWCWVQFFFVLSGFVLYLAYAADTDEWSWVKFKSFLRKRVSTFYPVFALAMIIALMNPESRELSRHSPGQLVSTMFLVQSWMRPYGNPLLNGPSWYLCSLVAFYLLFPRWLRQVRQCAQPTVLLCILWAYCWALAIAIASLSVITGRPAEEDLDAGLTAFLDFHPACNWHLFLFGMVLARCCSVWSEQIQQPLLLKPALLIACSLLFLILLFVKMECPGHVLRVFFNKGAFLLPVFSSLLTGFATLDSEWLKKWDAQDKSIQGWAWCLYILHVPLFYSFRGILADNGITNPLILVGVAAVACACVHLGYDQPLQRRLRDMTRARTQQSLKV
jgi:peptidoglycan/LPS O-acetylase OafA/YrhL